ncbi:MAG: hypothetical protein K2M15_03795 [Oscillospiraceae bacterium]|nr:hypothetical protein [Oscillospiraceae bacterium]
MKRFMTLLLALMMVLSLAACGEGGLSLDPNSKTSTPSSSDDGKDKDDKDDNKGDNKGDDTDDNKGDDKSGGEDGLIYPDEDGLAMGYAGDTLRTAFFDMTINDPYTCDEFDGLIPDEGYKFLVAELTLYNYTDDSQPMFDTDFEVIWDLDDDDAWAWPEYDTVTDANGEPEYFVRSDKQLPTEYTLGIHKTITGILLYQVPVDSTDYYIDFYELYDDGTDEGRYGDSFYVRFSE